LAVVAAFKVLSNAGIHTRPVKTLHEMFFCFVDAVVPGEELAMSILNGRGDEQSW
jgi:hypothetical protein